MIAATRSQKRVSGERLEDLDKNPSNLQKELVKIAQKNKNKKVEFARQGRALEQAETTNDVPELPFVDVQPLPNVGRGQTKAKSVLAETETVLRNCSEFQNCQQSQVLKTGRLCSWTSVPRIWSKMH
jgi:hypothetical protein